MKKPNFLLSLALGTGLTFAMIGCSSDFVDESVVVELPPQPARMTLNYALSTGDIPLPNDLLFGGSTDLTLNIPTLDDANFADPSASLSTLDGWSAVAPFAINFSSSDANLALDGSSIVAGSTIRVFKVNVFRPDINFGLVDENGEALPNAGVIVPSGPVTSVDRELVGGLEYVVVQASATSIAIIPTVPFEQQASYMVLASNGLLDTDGLAVLNALEFGIVRLPVPPSQAALIPVHGLVNAMINAASAADATINFSNTIVAYQFTVQSVGAVMGTAKLAHVDGAVATAVGTAQALGSPVTGALTGDFTFLVDTTPFTGAGLADLYKGSLTNISYLLSAPTEENPAAPLNLHWKAAEELPIGPEGALVPNPFGDNLSYANVLPRVNGLETAPLLVAMPKTAACPKPENGYPVTIFQHGITSNRTAILGLADTLALACRATVSMDLPLHGIAEDNAVHQGLLALGLGGLFTGYTEGGLRERTFGMDFLDNATGAPTADAETGLPGDGIPDSSGAHTINLAYLLTARDNNRQAILDILRLEQAIQFMDIDGDGVPDFDASDLAYIGHSLGGIVGTGVVAYSGTNTFLGADGAPSIKSAALVNPGGGTIAMLLASPTFGPGIRAGLSAAFGLAQDTAEFSAQLAAYSFAAQTIVDSSDPVNLAAHAVTNGIPTLLMENIGDTVVPNSVATAPLSGTEPLSRALALTTLSATEVGEVVENSRLFSKINIGGHGSILIPDDATAEMQSQVLSFLASGGTSVTVNDPSLLAE
ncbi:MAG: hypothetical protein ACJAS9_002280 [Polaribacter sp.]|jgi:hypothetical protein